MTMIIGLKMIVIIGQKMKLYNKNLFVSKKLMVLLFVILSQIIFKLKTTIIF